MRVALVRSLLILAWLWPLVVAGTAAAWLALVGDYGDRAIEWLIVVCFAGTPVVVGNLLYCLPMEWSEAVRVVVALFVAVVVTAGELFLAALIYTIALCWWGHIPV